jgi:hypothetical protein
MNMLREAAWLGAERATAYARLLAAFMAVALMFDWISTAIGHHPWGAMMGPAGKPQATDFLAFWCAGRLALTGHVGAAYTLPALAALEHATAIMDPRTLLAFFYPPTFLLLCLPFAALPYPAAFVAFVCVPLVSLAVGLRRILPADFLPRGAGSLWGYLPVAAFPGLLMNAATGQNGFWSAACFAWALLWLETRPALAGACLGMLVVKPHLALVVPVALLAARRWRALLACAAVASGWMAISFAVLGTAAWRGFLASAPAIKDALENHREDWGKLQSAFAAARILGAGLGAAYSVQMLVAVTVIAVLAVVAWRRPGAGAEVSAIVLAALLSTPHVLDYDLAACGVPLAWVAGQAARSGWRPWEKLAASVAFLWPLVARVATQAGDTPLAPVILGSLLVIVWLRGRGAAPGAA